MKKLFNLYIYIYENILQYLLCKYNIHNNTNTIIVILFINII